jgi:hypothetical protein
MTQTGITVENHTSSGEATNEWLFVTPEQAGNFMVPVGMPPLATLTVTAVDESQVKSLAPVEEKDAKHSDNDQVWLYPRAADSDGNEVTGVYYSWTLDGAAQQSDDTPPKTTGDLYRYHWDPKGAQRTVVATHGALNTQFSVQAHDGTVKDTTYLGCSSVPGAAPRGPLLSLVLLFLLTITKSAMRRGRNSDVTAPITNERGR